MPVEEPSNKTGRDASPPGNTGAPIVSVDEAGQHDVADPGAVLRDAREAAHFSIAYVAQRLKLPERIVEALEVNDKRLFPATVYLRGYVRNYAKLVGTDPEPLVNALATLTGEAAPGASVKQVVGNQTEEKRQSRHPLLVIIVGLVVGLAVLSIWQWPVIDEALRNVFEQAPPSDMTVPATVDGPTPLETATPDGPALGERDMSSTAQTQPDGGSPEPALETPDGEEPDVYRELLRVRRITPTGDDELWFEFAEVCWVEVLDTAGNTLYQELSDRQQSLRLLGKGPFQIRLGYAPGVSLKYNGEPVPLTPHTRDNAAALVIGQ